jgi:hypothetical protein
MKNHELKTELEKIAKFIPELRHELDNLYTSGAGKKSRLKQIWKQYEDKYKEIKNSSLGKTLQ